MSKAKQSRRAGKRSGRDESEEVASPVTPTNTGALPPQAHSLPIIERRFETPLPADKDILDYHGVREVHEGFDRLLEAGANGRELLDRIKVVVLLHRPECRVLKTTDWTAGTAYSPRTIKQVPIRLRKIAKDIARFNADPLLRPDIMPLSESHRYLYQHLPDILDSYSHALEGQTAKSARLVAELNRDRRICDKLKAHLPEWIHQVTGNSGRYFYGELADLLTAAFTADRQQRTVDPDALKMLHERSREHWHPPNIVEVKLDADRNAVRLTIQP